MVVACLQIWCRGGIFMYCNPVRVFIIIIRGEHSRYSWNKYLNCLTSTVVQVSIKLLWSIYCWKYLNQTASLHVINCANVYYSLNYLLSEKRFCISKLNGLFNDRYQQVVSFVPPQLPSDSLSPWYISVVISTIP